MLILVEGPDASGKSTLAEYLGDALDMPVQGSEGPPQYPGEMNDRLARYSRLSSHIIFDRHPAVSEEIYSGVLNRPIAVTREQQAEFYARKPFIIYCSPVHHTAGHLPDEHITKAHDTEDHLAGLRSNYPRIVKAYDDWAIRHAHVIYRIGDDKERFLHYVNNFVGDIKDFHEKFGLIYDGRPRHMDHELWEFRLRFMIEELCEYAGTRDVTKKLIMSAMINDTTRPPMIDQFDALIDLVYVALGTAYLQGFPFAQGWACVHRANMQKERALPDGSNSKRGSNADVIKPEGWRAPDLSPVLDGKAKRNTFVVT